MGKIISRISIFLATVFLISCGQQVKIAAVPQYKVEIKRTSYGIPHITANDLGSLGFGEGFAAAQDHVCNIADAVLVARGEQAKYRGVGANDKYVMSDIMLRALGIYARAEVDFLNQSEDSQEWFTGYASGYNKYIQDVGRDNLTSWCQGEKWVKEISPQDVFARILMLPQSTIKMASMIVSAAPPNMKKAAGLKRHDDVWNKQHHAQSQLLSKSMEEALNNRDMGSNGWAIGKDRTENGHGMLLANPHYPWIGKNRFWEKHLIIPRKMNIYGAGLIGIPGVGIGFNENVGWTHTVTPSSRVLFYTLDLVPGDPTSYYYDGKPRKMSSKTVKIAVKATDGKIVSREHTVWFSHYGPMVSLPNAPWTTKRALTVRDANFTNDNLFAQWKDMGLAKNMEAFKKALRKWSSSPWINTIATSRDGQAFYIDGSNVGRLSDEAIALWRDRKQHDPLTKKLYHDKKIILLDGSDSRFEWQNHPESRMPGVVPYIEQPKQARSDYVFNANDSYWLTNAAHPLSGYSPLFGKEETGRSLRTRMNAILLSDTSATGAAGLDGKFSLKELQKALFDDRSLAADLLRDDLVTACTLQNSVKIADKVIDLSEACAALKGYNKHLNLESKGAVLFREWITRYSYSDMIDKGALFAVSFDPKDPVNTPRDLSDKNLALKNLGLAILVMKRANLALDSSLADTQFAYRGKEKIALHGGFGKEGVANVIAQWGAYGPTAEQQVRGKKITDSPGLTDKGYVITGGSSFILSLSYTDNGPVAEAIMTYGQSGDATKAEYTDQTKLFAKKQWRPVLFKMDDINKDIISSIILTGPRPD